MHWIIARLRENSTWRGIVWLLTVAGLSLRPDQAEAIITVGMAVAGLLGVFTSDQPQNVPIETAPALPPIELVSRPEVVSGSAVAAQSSQSQPAADQLRDALPARDQPRPYQSADPNTYPRFGGGAGFGDRD